MITNTKGAQVKKRLVALMMAMAMLLTATPAHAAGGTLTVDPEGSGTFNGYEKWQHGVNKHSVIVIFDYPAGDPTPQRVKLNWNQSVGGKYMCLVPSGSQCTSDFGVVGKYTTDYSESNEAINSTYMGAYWAFASDGPWGAGRRLVLVFYPGAGHVEPSHTQNVALRVNIMDGAGTWVGWNATVVYVTS